VATAHDVEGDRGRRAREETTALGLRVSPGAEALWRLAEAVDLGRRGDAAAAGAAAAQAENSIASVPDFAGWWHLGTRLVAEDALDRGWGRPAHWTSEAGEWFAARGLDAVAVACRGLATKAGVKTRRRGRGTSSVPPHLDRLGVTSREMDVLTLVAQGLTNPQIAQRLYLSPATVKTYVEQLLAKTGAPNRTRLAVALTPPLTPPP
jgi:DNA-binding CsgD family transcriptional regulator